MLFLLDIAREQNGLAARVPHPARRLARVLLLFGQIGQCDVRALARISDCDRAPDTAVTAGDQRCLALHSSEPAIGLLAVVRLVLHFRFQPRGLLPGLFQLLCHLTKCSLRLFVAIKIPLRANARKGRPLLQRIHSCRRVPPAPEIVRP